MAVQLVAQKPGETQVWFCEGCCVVGCVALLSHIDVYAAIYRIEDAHRHTSPACKTPIRGVRIINNALITSLEALISAVPEWVRAPASQFLGLKETPL